MLALKAFLKLFWAGYLWMCQVACPWLTLPNSSTSQENKTGIRAKRVVSRDHGNNMTKYPQHAIETDFFRLVAQNLNSADATLTATGLTASASSASAAERRARHRSHRCTWHR
jgi:hypothetical protein